MKEKNDYYLYYKKLIQLSLEETVEDIPEYKSLYERYPHIAKSIKLRREINRLKQKIKSFEKGSERIQQKMDMLGIRQELRRENIYKNLFGENKRQTSFDVCFTFETSMQNVSQLKRMVNTTFRKAQIGLRLKERKLRRFLRKKLPPVVSNLSSLDISEKCLDVKEWIQKFSD